MNAKTEKYFNHKNGGYFMAIIEEMNDLLSQVQEKYDQVCMQRDHLQKRLMEFNAEEEIQKAKERVNSAYRHSLHVMSDKEMDARDRFVQRHYETCSCGKAGITFEYGLTGTGIGTAIYIRCTKCGEQEDITDFDNW